MPVYSSKNSASFDQAALRVKFGDAPSVASPGSDQTSWPKKDTVKVTMTPPPSLGLQPVENSYYINFHLPTENWEDAPDLNADFIAAGFARSVEDYAYPVQLDPAPFPVTVRGFNPGTTSSATGALAARAEYSLGGVSGDGENFEVIQKPSQLHFFVYLDGMGKELLSVGYEVAKDFAQAHTVDALSSFGGRVATRVLRRTTAPPSADGSPTISESILNAAVAQIFPLNNIENIAEQQYDYGTEPVTNNIQTFRDALSAFYYRNLSTIIDLPQARRADIEGALHPVNGTYDGNPLWRYFRLEPKIEQYHTIKWMRGDLYDHNGYVGRVKGTLHIPHEPVVTAVYRWVGN